MALQQILEALLNSNSQTVIQETKEILLGLIQDDGIFCLCQFFDLYFTQFVVSSI
jgi:hypothetical protein